MRGRQALILGGGLGGLRTAQALRDNGHEGLVTILSAEDRMPYDRPPLSKAFLLGDANAEDVSLIAVDALQKSEIDVRLGARGTDLDLAGRRLTLADGEQVAFDDLVIATGAEPIRLITFADMDNVVYLRDLGDATRLRDELTTRPRVGIIGGGFIGLEIASAARALDCEVIVIEATAAPLSPILGVELGQWLQAWHEEHGIRFHCGAPLSAATGAARVERLVLADDTTIDVDLVVVGVGVRPDVAWLGHAGLEVHHGLVCAADGRTSAAHVYGVGDVTCRHGEWGCRRTGHWTATNDHARAAADTIMDREGQTRVMMPGYFWSDQHDSRLQFAGTVVAEPAVAVQVGSMKERKFVALLSERDGDRVSGVFAMNSPRDFMKTSRATFVS